MNIHLQVIFSFHMFSPYQGLDLWISPSLINAQRSQGRAHCGLWNAWPIPLTNKNPSSSIPTCDSLLWISYLRMIYLISLPVWLRFKFKVQRSMAWSILKSRPATSSFWWYRWVRDLIYLYIYIYIAPPKKIETYFQDGIKYIDIPGFQGFYLFWKGTMVPYTFSPGKKPRPRVCGSATARARGASVNVLTSLLVNPRTRVFYWLYQ